MVGLVARPVTRVAKSESLQVVGFKPQRVVPTAVSRGSSYLVLSRLFVPQCVCHAEA